MEALIRRGRPGDGEAIARIHRESPAYYADQAPGLFNRPDEAGLAEFLEPVTSLLLVAEVDGEVVGRCTPRSSRRTRRRASSRPPTSPRHGSS
jgi:hypothetical protein